MAVTGPAVLPAAGDVLAGRYRLVGPLRDGAPGDPAAGPSSGAWSGQDAVLARPVVLHVQPAHTPAADALLRGAALAATVAAPGLARVWDASVERRPGRGDLAYAVCEAPAGRTVPERLRDGTLPTAAVVTAGRRLAGALAAAHAAGAVHGAVGPRAVLLGADDLPCLTGLGLAGPGPGATAADDVRDLCAVLHALLTGRWPDRQTPRPGDGLPPAASAAGRSYGPRQLRAGVPRDLDTVVRRGLGLLDPPLVTAAALAEELERVTGVDGEPRGDLVVRPGRRRALTAALLVGAAVAGAGTGALLLSRESTPPVPGVAPRPGAPEPTGPGGGAVEVDLAAATVTSFDPFGEPRDEKPELVPDALDGVVATAWTTEAYRSRAFGGLKPGVGLLVDLGAPIELAGVVVDWSTPGATVELRAGDALGPDHTSLPVVVPAQEAGERSELAVPTGTLARYVLVWVTALPADGLRAGVDELALLRRQGP